jgi:hypothetical protein
MRRVATTADGPPKSKTPESVRELPEMKNRRTTLLWMKDLIEHMSRCHEQLQWAADGPSESFLTDAMLGDVSEFQRLCQELRTPPAPSRSLAPSA